MFYFFSESKFRMSKKTSSSNELTQLILEIDNPSYNPYFSKYEKGSVNGVTVSTELREENQQSIQVLIIKLEATNSLPDVDQEFRNLISELQGLNWHEKHKILTQYQLCLKQHGLYNPDKSNHGHESTSGTNCAC